MNDSQETLPLTGAEINQMLIEALCLEVRALTLAQLFMAGNVGVEGNVLATLEAAQKRADALVRGTYVNEGPGAPDGPA